MPDQLRERFDALRSAVEHTDAAGLHDVRVRRTRRTRSRIAAATAATVAAVAIGGVVVLPQWGDERATSAGGADVLSDSAGGAADDRTDSDDEIAAGGAPAEDAAQGPLTLTADSLLTAPELTALGEENPQPQADDPGPVFPPLCDATTGTQQYSDPDREISMQYAVLDATLNQYAAEYASESVATQAMDRLFVDARSCPDSNPLRQVSVTSRTPGEALVLGFVELYAGPNGGPRFSEITILRAANVVIEVALIPLAMGLGDGAARVRALAEALVAKL